MELPAIAQKFLIGSYFCSLFMYYYTRNYRTIDPCIRNERFSFTKVNIHSALNIIYIYIYIYYFCFHEIQTMIIDCVIESRFSIVCEVVLLYVCSSYVCVCACVCVCIAIGHCCHCWHLRLSQTEVACNQLKLTVYLDNKTRRPTVN